MSDIRLIHGDCREVLATLPADSLDACVTDPPYDLTAGKKGGTGQASVNLDSPYGRARITTGFMGKPWDGTGVAFDPVTWRSVCCVLKPGAYLLAFGGSRTYHRMACAVEDAGFEIRDCIQWLYGSAGSPSRSTSTATGPAGARP
jgi:DNA modification methylase